MASERITIYDSKRKKIGTAPREEVHEKGYWHETFQCWFVHNNDIYLQIRSNLKKDFPGLLDITAAGHLLATESLEDGVREIQEELGIDVDFSELKSLGIIKDCIELSDFIDNEFANVFVYEFKPGVQQFYFQDEEVSGMVKTDLNSFYKLWLNEVEEIQVSGFRKEANGESKSIHKKVNKNHFAPHNNTYFLQVLDRIKKINY